MDKFIPYIKLSKQKQAELNKKRRGTWGELKPITRKPQNPKAYNRKKAQQQMDTSNNAESFIFLI